MDRLFPMMPVKLIYSATSQLDNFYRLEGARRLSLTVTADVIDFDGGLDAPPTVGLLLSALEQRFTVLVGEDEAAGAELHACAEALTNGPVYFDTTFTHNSQ